MRPLADTPLPSTVPTLQLPANHALMHVFSTLVEANHDYHDHSFLEVVLVTGGSGVHISPSGSYPLKPGDVIVLRPGAWHAYKDCDELEVINCCLGVQFLLRDLAFFSEQGAFNDLFWFGPLSGDNRGVLHLHLEKSQRIDCEQHLGTIATNNPRHEDPCIFAESIGHLLIALSIVARAVAPVDRASVPGATHPAVLACRRLLAERCEYDWALSEIAREVHIAPAYLVRLFKRDTGMAPIAFLTRCRAERAAQLLLQTNKSIAQIGEEVGWRDASYFARCFKKNFGISASEYRERFA